MFGRPQRGVLILIMFRVWRSEKCTQSWGLWPLLRNWKGICTLRKSLIVSSNRYDWNSRSSMLCKLSLRAIKTAFWKRSDAGNNSLYADSRWGKVECAVVDWMISEGRSHPCKARFGSNHRLFEWFRPEHSAWKYPSQLKCASHYTKMWAMGAGYSIP